MGLVSHKRLLDERSLQAIIVASVFAMGKGSKGIGIYIEAEIGYIFRGVFRGLSESRIGEVCHVKIHIVES